MEPRSAFGVDIGKSTLHVCRASEGHPSTWPVIVIDLTEPGWHVDLINSLEPGCLICAEPTGYHYFQPLALIAFQFLESVDIWQVNHAASGMVRELEVATSKTDEMDSRALAYIARRISTGEPPRGAKPYRLDRESKAAVLRSLLNTYTRVTKDQTRLMNQLDQIAHGIWPQLAQSKGTWLNAARVGAVSPADLHALPAIVEGMTGRQRSPITRLAQKCPPEVDCPAYLKDNVRRLIARLDTLEAERADLLDHIEAVNHQEPFAAITARWLTIPGITPQAIAAFHIATGGAADLLTKDEFVACLAVAPRTDRSGYRDKTGQIKRKGYKPAMIAVYLLTMYMLSPSAPANPLKPYKASLEARGVERIGAPCRRKMASILSGIARNPAGRWFSSTQE